jgi:UDP-3-O-acyl-N-acetylglucosamine deacetylase
VAWGKEIQSLSEEGYIRGIVYILALIWDKNQIMNYKQLEPLKDFV